MKDLIGQALEIDRNLSEKKRERKNCAVYCSQSYEL